MSSRIKSIIKRKSRKYFGEEAQTNSIVRLDKQAQDNLSHNPMPELTAEDKQNIDRFWEKYGIRFKDYGWFQWLYGVTGIKDPKFIPQTVHFRMLNYFNNIQFADAYKDKNFFDRLLPNVPFPKTILKKINGYFFDKTGAYLPNDPETLADYLLPYGEVIVKNAWDTGRGENVRKYTLNTVEDAKELLKIWDVPNYIVQEVLHQHDFLKKFNESSVNIIRTNSWFHDGKVEIFSPVLRVGMPGEATDCCFIDGEEVVRMIGVEMDGTVRDTVVNLDGTKFAREELFPGTGGKIPGWEKVLDMIRNNAPMIPHFRYIGWDIAITPEEEPVCIEYNIYRPSSVASQVTNGPLWGDLIEESLSFLLKKENQEKYIPKYIRI